MLPEGTIIESFMLTKLLCQTAAADLYQSIHVETGERYLTKIALSDWRELPGAVNCRAFEFAPGLARRWQVSPSELLRRETMHLQDLEDLELALPKPLVLQELEGATFACYAFFDGVTLASLLERNAEITGRTLANLFSAVQRLEARRLFHGNLQPESILIGPDGVLLVNTTMSGAEFSASDMQRIERCVTTPEYYPFLDPRQDQLALGILIYLLFTGKQLWNLDQLDREERAARRAGPRLSQLIDEARERGANRFVRSILSFRNPAQVKRRTAGEYEELILKTLGFARTGQGINAGVVEIIENTWLDAWFHSALGVAEQEPQRVWGLTEAAATLGEFARQEEEMAGGAAHQPVVQDSGTRTILPVQAAAQLFPGFAGRKKGSSGELPAPSISESIKEAVEMLSNFASRNKASESGAGRSSAVQTPADSAEPVARVSAGERARRDRSRAASQETGGIDSRANEQENGQGDQEAEGRLE